MIDDPGLQSTRSASRHRTARALLCACVLVLAPVTAAGQSAPVDGLPGRPAAVVTDAPAARWLRAALDAACADAVQPDAVLAALGGGIELAAEDLDAPQGMLARRHRLLLPDGRHVRVDTHRRDGRLAQAIVEVGQRIAGVLRPRWWLVADGGCRTRVARRIDYREDGTPEAVQLLDASLDDDDSRLLLDAPVPPGAVPAGVPVAMVDSGVNYELPAIAARLARDASGRALGHDYWDEDPRPFDSHPSRSPFLPQRHGTRTASLVLADAPVAVLVPMRYPRPDMSRMARLVADAAALGIDIVNLSLGGSDAAQWRAFEDAARAHPQILFVASAGNEGRDLDERPVYPAALDLENLITVTSADAQGLPARGSNWGRRTVDLLIPAEEQVTTDFNGYAALVSGSSYAAARVSALAACLKAANPQWHAPELKQAIFARAQRTVYQDVAYVAVGLLADPLAAARGACAAEPTVAARIGSLALADPAPYPGGAPDAATHRLAPLTLVWIEDAGWPLDAVPRMVAQAGELLAQCAVRFSSVQVELVRVPRRQRYFDSATAIDLVRELPATAPSVWLVRDTLQQPAFDAEAIGRSNLGGRGPLLNTVWMTSHLEHPGVALAHELYHVIANTGGHVPEKDNLMHSHTSTTGTRLADWQCDRLLQVGKAFGLIEAVAR